MTAMSKTSCVISFDIVFPGLRYNDRNKIYKNYLDKWPPPFSKHAEYTYWISQYTKTKLRKIYGLSVKCLSNMNLTLYPSKPQGKILSSDLIIAGKLQAGTSKIFDIDGQIVRSQVLETRKYIPPQVKNVNCWVPGKI